MTWTFAYPLVGLLLIPLAFAAWRLLRGDAGSGLLFPALARLPANHGAWRIRAVRMTPYLWLAGLLLLIVAAARPRSLLEKIRRDVDALAIAMVVDVSGSMRALDFADPESGDRRSRLDVVKKTFAEFIAQRPNDLIALLTFGGYVSTRSPLTADHKALIQMLETVRIPGEDPDSGPARDNEELLTAIGDALATACARLRDAEPKTRIIVLLSDGESNAGLLEPQEAADIAARLGLRIYTIGVGTTGRVPFPARDVFGRETIRRVNVSIDEKTLEAIAAKTGGRYFNVLDETGLRTALEEIHRLETTPVSRDVYLLYREHYLPFAAAGASLIALAACLNLWLLKRIV